ncbi:cytochrome P450 2D17 isoform X2 [Marmota monax]|uniref:cytochrome P450 2D17 isoform X2 n=1 Tax=Marmota monax TaxID=9995 RepID=UPI0026EE66B7|nr:cytochrome P450 2D17 isoform X2 [Marmota monax]
MGLLTGDALWALSVAVAVFLLLVDLMHRRQRWAARYPPGPLPLPGLGNLLQIDFQNMPSSFQKMRFRFGDVFSLQLAWKPVIVLNGLAAVREALVNHSEYTSDRPWMSIYDHLGLGPRSQGKFQGDPGKLWACLARAAALLCLDDAQLWPGQEVPGAVGDRGGQLPLYSLCQRGRYPFSPMSLLKRAMCNVISSLIYARRFKYDDQRLAKMLDLLEDMLKEDSGFVPMVLNVVPVLLRIPGLPGWVFRAQKAFMDMVDELLEEHRMTWDPAQPPRDLTDAFLAEVEKAKGNPESSFNDENLRIVVLDLFTAGMVTTSTTLAWALLLMILHPDVQRRVQQEIDEVIGQVRQPEMGDQARMPFTMAVIHEVQRFGDLVPLAVPHLTTRDIELQGFLIPKGTTLITNLSSVLKDETVWEKPLHFHPGHFLDAQGHFVKREAFMPFSAGRRVCLGEPLARMELFLFFTCLLQRFSFSVPPGQARPSDYGVFGTIVTPSPYQLCAEPR